MKCAKCGISLQRLMLMAIMVDAGTKVVPSPLDCSEGGEHDFSETANEIEFC